MKAYFLATGTLFAMIVVAHVARIVDEWPPTFSAESVTVQSLTLLAAVFSIWAFVLLFRKPKP
jgi:hypothetical protein